MALLPGWDRPRLLTAASADVEGARMIVYATALEPTISEPYDAHLEVLDIEAIENPKRREAKVRSHRARRRGSLLKAIAEQKRHRELLGLDEDVQGDAEDEAEA